MRNKIISFLNARFSKRKKIKLKLSKFLYNHQKKIPALAGLCLFLGILLTIGVLKNSNQLVAGNGLSKLISTSIPSAPDLKNLDFGKVERFKVPNAKSTVIYIPQLHKEPTSNAADKTNDQAFIVQKEISDILEKLVDVNHVKYVMDETDLYGPMPADKIQKIKNGFSDIEKIKLDLKSVLNLYLKNGGSTETANTVKKNAEEKLNGFERNIYLTGGAAVLAAKDQNAYVYGSQNPATINEAKIELQNLVYMEQRINQLETQNSTNGTRSVSTSSTNNQSAVNILSMLGSGGNSNNKSSLQPIIDFANKTNDTELLNGINKVSTESKAFTIDRSYETTPAMSTNASASQINVNPYQNVTNLTKLKQDYQVAYDKFIKLAKDQRSQEVSDNVDRMMQENGQSASVLVLGKDHKDQIISDLNKKGINVIVITPESLK